MNARRAFTLACAALLCSGCAPRCVLADRAAINLNVACAAAGMETVDPILLVRCDSATRDVRRALRDGACAAELAQ